MLRWSLREPPLLPRGLVVRGASGTRLAQHLAHHIARRETLTGLASGDALVVLGPTRALPWVEGAAWVGPDPTASDLWTRTTQQPDAPVDLVLQALRSRVQVPRPWLLLPGGLVFPLGAAGPLDPAALQRWASR